MRDSHHSDRSVVSSPDPLTPTSDSCTAGSVSTADGAPALLETEAKRVLIDSNRTATNYPRDLCVHQLFESQVKLTPEATAVEFEGERVSYLELNHHANQLAHFLRSLGLGPDLLAGICLERSVAMVTGLLGILKAGGAYVPLDPTYPTERLHFMLEDSRPKVLLTEAHLQGLFMALNKTLPVLDLGTAQSAVQAQPKTDLAPETIGLCPQHLAYVIYTSGSTGMPKGAMNEHHAVCNRLFWMQDAYRLTAGDAVLQKTPFSFDVSVWEFFWPLLAGARLVMARPEGHKDPSYLCDTIQRSKITTLHFVPSMLQVFLDHAHVSKCSSLARVVCSGEALPAVLARRFKQTFPNVALYNLYGPTEAAVDVTAWTCPETVDNDIIPIGRPIANTRMYILDEAHEPVPVGTIGELYIGGVQVARGYLNRPELTKERFLTDPLVREPGARMYRTGDIGRWLPDGNIEYLGRNDSQVKIRGFRIELGEIEARLTEYPGIKEAAVLARENQAAEKQLVAYYTEKQGEEVRPDQLRAHIFSRLPEYMVPALYVHMPEMPLSPNGKLDRRALPAPDTRFRTGAGSVAPRDSLESMLLQKWQAVLGVTNFGVTDNFFDLGGDSLNAVTVLVEIEKEIGCQIPVSALLHGATVESLAKLIREGTELGPDPVLMTIQSGNSLLPFFAIVPPGEDSLGYAILARHTGPDQTIYKLQGSKPIISGVRPTFAQDELRSLSSEYIAAMRTAQPEGPYCLGAMCDGVQIAERMVLDLEEQGHEVGLFAIFDTWVLQNVQRPFLWRLAYYRQRLRDLRKKKVSEQVGAYKQALLGNLSRLLRGQPSVKTEVQQAFWPEQFVARRFRAPVTLFKRPKQPFNYVKDPYMGWGVRSQGGVHIHEVNLDHNEIFREPHVRTLGQLLAGDIRRVGERSNISGLPSGIPTLPSLSENA